MQLRTRIAVTFLALLGVVIGAALLVVSYASHRNAELEVKHQFEVGGKVLERVLESNRRLLTNAAQVLALDYGFREAVGTNDAATIASALENNGTRIGARLVELVSLDGKVIAATGPDAAAGTVFAHQALLEHAGATEHRETIAVERGHVYQLVMVPVRLPLPVAWIVMGFAIDDASVHELASVTGLDVTLALNRGGAWRAAASSLDPAAAAGALAHLGNAGAERNADVVVYTRTLETDAATPVTVVLSRSLEAVRAQFAALRNLLIGIALASLTLTAVAAFWLARNITRPLQVLTTAIESIRGGRYDTPFSLKRRDELGVLAEGLEHMQHAVESRDRDIRTLAYTDRLTDLMNRTAFTEALAQALAAREQPIAVAIINLRRFRRINECLGYAVGDEVLRQIALRLGDGPKLSVALARLGADQFAAVTPLGPGASVEYWGTQLLERLVQPVLVSTQQIDISAVVGLASAPRDASDADELLRAADLAVESARRDNRGLKVYDATLRVATREQLSLLGELQRAIDAHELALAFQPKLKLGTGELVGAEALVRWRHPTRGLLMPSAFIPFAEQTGFIRKLTRWALREGARIASSWAEDGEPLNVSVNMSADDLADPGLDQYLRQTLSETRLPGHLLTLELTESGFIGEPTQALARLELLKTLGIKLSIDDFGTGYSSLSYLTRMPVDELKIDRSFVIAIAGSPQATAVVQAAIEMGHSLGLSVVAEGIEDKGTAADLAALGCDVGQGYVYAKPLFLEDFVAWRRAHDAATARIEVVAPSETVVRRLRAGRRNSSAG